MITKTQNMRGYDIYSKPILLPGLQPKNAIADFGLTNIPLNENELLNIYPNPVTNGELSFEYLLFNKGATIQIFDIKGRLMFSKPADNSFGLETIDVSGFESGEYFIRIGDLKGRFTIVK
jgi:hypothetical protein